MADSSPHFSVMQKSANKQTRADSAQTDNSSSDQSSSASTDAQPPNDLWERIRRDLSWQDKNSPRIDKAREEILRQPKYLPTVADRADFYLYYIVEEVKKRDMPIEIALLPLVESGLDPFASSPSGAAGLWQIMPETGIVLGLEQDKYYDGRHAVLDSTTVALDYLEKLYKQFDDDWLLAVAAYNSGAGNIAKAQEINEAKGLGTDYWSLKLPAKNNDYVSKLIALAQIVADPERFDVKIPKVENAPSFEVADTKGLPKLSRAAELAGVDMGTLRALNPGQRSESISPTQPCELLLPVGTLHRYEDNIAKLSPEELVQWKTYRVQPGDSLNQIAKKFDTQVAVLQEANSIRGSNIQAGETLKIPGDAELRQPAPAAAKVKAYSVRAGDSLYDIADRFNVSVNDLVAWNSLNPSAYLQPGQKLKLHSQ
jgi:membrane-bound lytic murein transglycosylase D